MEKEIRKITKRIKKGDVIKLMCNSEEVACYEFIEWSIDSKSPIDWLRGCLIFEIKLRGKNINDCSIEFQAA